MSEQHKLSLPAAILININIMLGAGIFINTVELARRAGLLGFLAYGIIGILLLPLISSIAQLVNRYPTGGFYTFSSKEMNTFSGFLSTWSYFTGKLASATLLIHTASLLIKGILPAFSEVNVFVLDGVILTLFILLNMLNIRTGRSIQAGIVVLKLIPIFFVILVGIFYLSGANFTTEHLLWAGVPSTLPLVLFAVLGFEATCSLSNQIQNPQRNGPLAILISYAIVISLLMLYQLFFYASIGQTLQAQASYLQAFPALLALVFPLWTALIAPLKAVLYFAITASALGGAYGILYSNNWNLHLLALNGHTFFPSALTRLNKHLIPYVCVLIEGVLCIFYFLVTHASQIPLQQISALSCTITYTFSVIALYKAKKSSRFTDKLVPLFALINCTILLLACVQSIAVTGLLPLAIIAFLWTIGISMYLITKKFVKQLPQF